MVEKSLVLLKPDCLERRLVGRVISRFEDKGLSVTAMRLMVADEEVARRHYAEHVKRAFYPDLEAYFVSGPMIAMVVEGPEAIRVIRKMVGATNGLEAAPGTIRGDFSTSNQANLVHASDSPEAAVREIEIFFPCEG
ncbi:MAG: nucleoside-diphosphate kinase [Thermoguttaceae bacterium]